MAASDDDYDYDYDYSDNDYGDDNYGCGCGCGYDERFSRLAEEILVHMRRLGLAEEEEEGERIYDHVNVNRRMHLHEVNSDGDHDEDREDWFTRVLEDVYQRFNHFSMDFYDPWNMGGTFEADDDFYDYDPWFMEDISDVDQEDFADPFDDF